MDSFAMLNEEVFKHLCSLAIDKVSDKTEKRKAGCGGVAMRKRLLIKNFVNDLCRKKAEDEELEEMSSSHECYNIYDQHEVEEGADSSIREVPNSNQGSDISDENLEDGDVIVPDDDVTPAHDIWLDSAAIPERTSLSDAIIFESVHAGREGAIGRLDDKSSESRLTMYSLYSSVSESADRGEETLSACNPQESLIPNCLYDCVQSPTFDTTSLASLSTINNLASMCDISNVSTIQPVLAGESDEIFLSLGNHKYSDLKTYNPALSSPSSSVLAAGMGSPPRTSCSAATKRRSDEVLLYDSISAEIMYQKKIKL